MGTLGVSATIGAFVISGLSDRLGRRPLMIVMPLVGVILPLGALYYTGSVWLLAAMFFVGWGLNGIFPLFMATIPSESVDPLLDAKADFTKGDHAGEKRFGIGGLQPARNPQVRLGRDKLGNDVGIDEKAVHNSTGLG